MHKIHSCSTIYSGDIIVMLQHKKKTYSKIIPDQHKGWSSLTTFRQLWHKNVFFLFPDHDKLMKQKQVLS